MKQIVLNSNYKIDRINLPSPSFEKIPTDCDEILDEFINDIKKENQKNVFLGTNPEHIDIKGRHRSVRVVKVYDKDQVSDTDGGSGLHRVSVDVVLNQINDKLTVGMQLCANTWLKYLTIFVQIGLGILFFGILAYFYLSFGGVKSILLNYVQTNVTSPTNDAPAVAQELLKQGFKFYHFFIGFNEHFPSNIAVIISSSWMVITAICGICGFFVYKIPPWMYSIIFRLLGQPTIKEFEDFAASHAAWVQHILGGTLRYLRIDEQGVLFNS